MSTNGRPNAFSSLGKKGKGKGSADKKDKDSPLSPPPDAHNSNNNSPTPARNLTSPTSSVSNARRMFEQLSAGASSPSSGSPSLPSKKTAATSAGREESSNRSSSPVPVPRKSNAGHQLRKTVSAAVDVTSSPKSTRSVSETSYSSDTGSRPKQKPARPPPPVPSSNSSTLIKSQSATEAISTAEVSKESPGKGRSVSPSAAALPKEKKGKGKEKDKEKEKKEKEKKEKEREKEKEKENKEKEREKEKEKERKEKEKEKKEKEKKEKEREKEEKKEKDKEKGKEAGAASATCSSASAQSKDKPKGKSSSLFGKGDKTKADPSKEKASSSLAESKDKSKSGTSTPEPTKEDDRHSPSSSSAGQSKEKDKTLSETSKEKEKSKASAASSAVTRDKDKVKSTPELGRDKSGSKGASGQSKNKGLGVAKEKTTSSPSLAGRKNKDTGSPSLSGRKNKDTGSPSLSVRKNKEKSKAETSTLLSKETAKNSSTASKTKMEDDKGKPQKEGGASSKHTSPTSSPSRSNSTSSTASGRKPSKSVRATGGNLKSSGAGVGGGLSTEKGATGSEVKTRKIGPLPTTTSALSDKDLEISLGDGTTITGAELRSVLNKQLVYVSGGFEEDKHPILTFPEVGLRHLDSSTGIKDLNITLLYLKSLMSIADLNAGMTLLLDARISRTHTPAKHLLEKILSKEVPLDVHVVYIYTKTSIFGRNKNLIGPEISGKLHIAYLYDQKSLVEQLDVTTDLGGTLNYNHKIWVYNRLEYEKVQRIHSEAMAQFAKLTEALNLCEVPSCVKDAEHLMQEDLKLKETLANKMAEAELSSDRFLDALKHQQPVESIEMSPDTKELLTMMASLGGMLQELKAEQGKFDSFWVIHKARVDHMMRMCHFNRSAEKLKVLMNEYIDDVKSGGIVLGDSLETALELGEKHEAFVAKCKITMDGHMGKIREDAQVLLNPSFVAEEEGKMHAATQQAIDTVKAQVEELKKSYKELIDLCQQKRDLFIVCVKFHMTTRQVQQWNQDVLEFVASLPLEDMSLMEATSNLSRIDDLQEVIHVSQLTTMTELADSLPGEKQFKKMASKAKEKYEQTCTLLETRKAHIMKQQAAMTRSTSTQKLSKSIKKNKVELINGDGSGSTPPASRTPSSINPEASVFLAKTLGGDSSEHTDGESDTNVLKSRQFIYKELLATEKVYIEDLKVVLNSYYDAMDPEESTSIPLRLRDKRNVVFGNLPEIHKFHESVFSQALERYAEHPERVGECFIQFTDEFQMYSVYCKNRTQSEALINECTESQAFFKGIQLNLAHQLSLDSYLLKPVQRITKYQLLLKDMMKRSVNAKKAHSDLKQALDRMLKVLKTLNDSLHVVGLKGFPGALAEQGRLLVHDPFQMWEESSTSRSLFSRARERHVFLFEKMVIFSKKIEAAAVQKREKKSDNYLYKGHLQMAEIGLRPTSDGQPLQFELNIHGQQKVFRFQAQTKDVREMWFSEIRRLLEAQFTLMKDVVLKSGTLDRRSYKGKTQLSTSKRESRLFTDSIDNQSMKKSFSLSDRFKLLKRRKGGPEKLKKTVSSHGIDHSNSDSPSPLLQSCSLPPTVVHSIRGGGAGRSRDRDAAKGLSQSNCELGRYDEDGDSVSSDEEFPFSDDDDSSIGVAVEHYETLAPSAPRYYLAICDYNPGDSEENGISLTDTQEVEVIGINQYGWWWVRATNASSGEVEEGWVPASYLKVSKRAL